MGEARHSGLVPLTSIGTEVAGSLRRFRAHKFDCLERLIDPLPVRLAYSIVEAAAATGYSTDTIRRAIRNNDLTARYANSKPVILAGELQSWLESLPTEAPGRRRSGSIPDDWWLEPEHDPFK